MENIKQERMTFLDGLLTDVEKTRNQLRRIKSFQVRSKNEISDIRALTKEWFQDYKPGLPGIARDWETVLLLDENFKLLDKCSHYATSRKRYIDDLKLLMARLLQLRYELISSSSKSVEVVQKNIPNLEKLISDSSMRQIVYRRWAEIEETINCAPLSCIVMIGALLEALMLARIHKLDDEGVIYKLKSTPQDQKEHKPLNLSKWTLSHFIAVSHEMGWIRKAAKDISSTIMEYRNLIHPEKQWRLNIILEPQDSKIMFVVFGEISKQLIESI